MKDRKKPKGTKARVQAYKKRLTHIGHAITIATLVGIIAVSSFLLYSMLYSPSEQPPINPTLQITTDNPNPPTQSRHSRPPKPHSAKPNLHTNSHKHPKTSRIHSRLLPRRKSHSRILQKPTNTWLWLNNSKGTFCFGLCYERRILRQY